MTIVLDGFNAPVTAGNFADLIQRGFYDGMEIQRSDGFVVQSGKPSAKGADGRGHKTHSREFFIYISVLRLARLSFS
jgi:cyclophilin family peptidyl-prolyl cis-trans isomerase